MKILVVSIYFVVLLLDQTLVQADIFTELDDHLQSAQVSDTNGGLIGEALRFTNSKAGIGKKILGIFGKDTVIENLEGLKSIQEKKVSCIGQASFLIIKRAFLFASKLKPDGKLKEVAKKAFESLFDECSQVLIDDLNSREDDIEKLGVYIESIADSSVELCDDLDKSSSLWKYDCMRKVQYIDIKNYAPAFLAAVKKLKSEEEFRSETASSKSKVDIYIYLKRALFQTWGMSCDKLKIKSVAGYDDTSIKNFKLLKDGSGRDLTKDIEDLLKKASAGLDFCWFYDPENFRLPQELVNLVMQ